MTRSFFRRVAACADRAAELDGTSLFNQLAACFFFAAPAFAAKGRPVRVFAWERILRCDPLNFAGASTNAQWCIGTFDRGNFLARSRRRRSVLAFPSCFAGWAGANG